MMSVVTVNRQVDLAALPFPATMRWEPESGSGIVEADVTEAELQASVDAAPTAPDVVGNQSIIDQAITDALTELRNLVNAGPLPTVPDGTMTTAQLSSAVRTLRNEAQATRAGAQRVADILLKTIRLVRGDFDDID